MAIWGIGAYYDNEVDRTEDFVREGLACIGWPPDESPSVHELFRRLRVGDIVYIKAFPPGGPLFVKAIGIVLDDSHRPHPSLKTCVEVGWVWRGYDHRIEIEGDRYNVRRNTLYEELHPVVQAEVLRLLLSGLQPPDAPR